MQVYNWIDFIQSILFPNRCPLCSGPLGPRMALCPACQQELPYIRSACPVCALPVTDPAGRPCGRCIRQPPPFTASVVPLRYEPPYSRLIGDLKFHHRLHLAEVLSLLFCASLPPEVSKPDLLIPIPLHPRRLRERGFNQSLELGRRIAGEIGLNIDWRSLRRIRATPPQSRLDKRTRRANLRSAFAADGRVSGRHIALFDDVITTGATVTAASQALLRAGAERVDVWALARTPLP